MPNLTDNQKSFNEYTILIDACSQIEPAAKEILKFNPTSWIKTIIHSFEKTIKTSRYNNELECLLAETTFVSFIKVLESTNLILENDLCFVTTEIVDDSIEEYRIYIVDTLLDALENVKR